MKKSDYPKFAQKWNSVNEAKQGKTITERGLMQIFQVLQCYSLDDICMALDKFLMNPDEGLYHLQPPSIVKIIEGDSDFASNRAWNIAENIAKSIGWSDDLVLDDKVMMKCIHELGFQRLCTVNHAAELTEYSKQFKALYKHYRVNGFDGAPAILKGQNNIQRASYELPLLKPRYIGLDGKEVKKQNLLPKPLGERYPEIENSQPVDIEVAKNNLKKLMSIVKS